MAPAYVLDESLRGPLWKAIQRHNVRGVNPLDVVRVGDPADLPLASLDPDILLWAEREERILVSEDRKTLARHLADHLDAGHHSPGIFVVPQPSPLVRVVEFLELAAHASDPAEWRDWIKYLN